MLGKHLTSTTVAFWFSGKAKKTIPFVICWYVYGKSARGTATVVVI
jgi:hypothetical protein